MLTPGVYEHGAYRIVIKEDFARTQLRMFVLYKGQTERVGGTVAVTMDDGSMLFTAIADGVVLEDEHALCAWGINEDINDVVSGFFEALAHVFIKEESEEFRLGRLTGENIVLRQVAKLS
jgi:hypothetical protein